MPGLPEIAASGACRRPAWLAGLVLVVLLGGCVGPRPIIATLPSSQISSPLPQGGGAAGPSPEAGRFTGMAAQEVLEALGKPSYRRRDAPAEVWQYYGQSCVLDLFLYDDRGIQRVIHAEIRGQAATPDNRNCVSQLVAGKKG